jgi:hypothetical protein
VFAYTSSDLRAFFLFNLCDCLRLCRSRVVRKCAMVRVFGRRGCNSSNIYAVVARGFGLALHVAKVVGDACLKELTSCVVALLREAGITPV